MKGQVIPVGGVRVIVAGANAAGTAAGPGSVSYPTGCLIRNPAGNGTVYFGGYDVTSTTSCFPLLAGEFLEVDLVNEFLWAIATTTATIYMLRRGD